MLNWASVTCSISLFSQIGCSVKPSIDMLIPVDFFGLDIVLLHHLRDRIQERVQ